MLSCNPEDKVLLKLTKRKVLHKEEEALLNRELHEKILHRKIKNFHAQIR